jgi:predicted PolB exonuclease-like 3'-5' exonuclease
MREKHAIIWDLETIPDLEATSRLFDMVGEDEDAIRDKLGDGFPKLPLHKIACIGALIAKRDGDVWTIESLGAPHIGERPEGELIKAFVDRIAELRPQLVSFNGTGFDLPVLRYRAMVNRVPAPGLQSRKYFYRYSEDSLDLCDALASFESRSKMKLDALSKIFGIAGKPVGVDGSKVEAMVQQGKIEEVAAYCETDLINTYRIWLLYEVFRGALSSEGLDNSEQQLREYVTSHADSKPHLVELVK